MKLDMMKSAFLSSSRCAYVAIVCCWGILACSNKNNVVLVPDDEKDPCETGSLREGAGCDPASRSCGGLASTCGPEKENCCASLFVPGGEFLRGYDVSESLT